MFNHQTKDENRTNGRHFNKNYPNQKTAKLNQILSYFMFDSIIYLINVNVKKFRLNKFLT